CDSSQRARVSTRCDSVVRGDVEMHRNSATARPFPIGATTSSWTMTPWCAGRDDSTPRIGAVAVEVASPRRDSHVLPEASALPAIGADRLEAREVEHVPRYRRAPERQEQTLGILGRWVREASDAARRELRQIGRMRPVAPPDVDPVLVGARDREVPP